MIYSAQGSQYTSKEFAEFRSKLGTALSMSMERYSYDNMDKYFKTLNNDMIYRYNYRTEEDLFKAVEELVYVHYIPVCLLSYNNYRTPYEACYGIKYANRKNKQRCYKNV